MIFITNQSIKFPRREKRGQFVIISATIIATFTLSLVLLIHQMSTINQRSNYNPVEELVLGVTSDLDRCLTYALRIASQNYNLTRVHSTAEAVGNEFIAGWGSSIVRAYSNIGLKFDLRKNLINQSRVDWVFDWGDAYGESFVYTQFSMDIDTYGFKGWTYASQKFLTLQIDNNSITVGPYGTKLIFTIEGGKEHNNRIPVQDLTPGFIKLTLSSNTTGNTTNPNITSLFYLGQGRYNLTFDQSLSGGDNLTITVTTPSERIIVEAYLGSSRPSEWSDVYLSRDAQGDTVLIPTRMSGGSGKIPSNSTQPGRETIVATSQLTPFQIYLADLINITLYLEVTQNQSPVTLKLTLAFNWNGTNYTIGNGSTQYMGDAPYTFQLNATKGHYPIGSKIVPVNSTFILTVVAEFERQPYGRLFLNYGTDAPSRIKLF